MNESELYRQLTELTKDKNQWEENVPYLSSLLSCGSEKIQAKAIWLLGEIGFAYPMSVREAIPAIEPFPSFKGTRRQRPRQDRAGKL